MFFYVKGTLEEVLPDSVVVETGGVGWQIYVPGTVLDRIPRVGTEIKLYTSFQVREDAMTLYGFLSKQDRSMFEQLLGVSGVGPKAAVGILSVLRPDDLRMAIISEDSKAIARAPGIGPKTAKRVILDLKDKIRMEDILAGDPQTDTVPEPASAASSGAEGAAKEAIEALVALGYSPTEATRAVRQVKLTEDMDTEQVLKASLKFLTFL